MTIQQIELAVSLAFQGWSPREIASAFTPESPDQWRVITDMVSGGMVPEDIAPRLGVSVRTVYRRLAKIDAHRTSALSA
jgi:DNA-directed RNA polymerase specialized sigma24 family protein